MGDRIVGNQRPRALALLAVCSIWTMPGSATAQIEQVAEITWEKADRNAFDELRIAIAKEKPKSDIRILLTIRPGEVNVVVEPVRKAIQGLPAKLDAWRISQGFKRPVMVEAGERSLGLSHTEGQRGMLRWERPIDLVSLTDSLDDLGTVGIGVSTSRNVSGAYVSGETISDDAFTKATVTVIEPQIITPLAEVTPLALLHLVGVLTVFPLTLALAGFAARKLKQNPLLTDAQKRERYTQVVQSAVFLPVLLHATILLSGGMNGMWDLLGRLWFHSTGIMFLMAFIPLGLVGLSLGGRQFDREGRAILALKPEEEWKLVRNESGVPDQAERHAALASDDGFEKISLLSINCLLALVASLVFIPVPQLALLAAQWISMTAMVTSQIILGKAARRGKAKHAPAPSENRQRLTDSMTRCTRRLNLPPIQVAIDKNRQVLPFSARVHTVPRELLVPERALTELTDDELDHLVLQALIWQRNGGLRRQSWTVALLYLLMIACAAIMPRAAIGSGGIQWLSLLIPLGLFAAMMLWQRKTVEPRRLLALADEAEAIRVLERPEASLALLRKLAAACQRLPIATIDQGFVPSVARRIAQAETMQAGSLPVTSSDAVQEQATAQRDATY